MLILNVAQNLVDFSIMGASLYKSLYPKETPNTALLNIGSEELKGNEIIKKLFKYLMKKDLIILIFLVILKAMNLWMGM